MVDSPPHTQGFIFRGVLPRLMAIFLPAGLLTGAVVAALYFQDLSKEHTIFSQSSAHLVDLQTDIIDRELKFVQSDLRYLAEQAVLRNFLSGNAAGKREMEAEYLLFSRQRGVYDQIRYLDADGQEQIRINYNEGHPAVVPEKDLQPKGNRYYFTETMSLNRGEVFISPLDLNVEHDRIEVPLKPVIRFATPVFDKSGTKRGVLVLNYLGQALIQKLAAVSASFPGSAWLLNRDGYYLRGPLPVDEWGFMWGRDRRFATDFPNEWNRVAWSSPGQILTDRGLFSFRTLFPRESVSPVAQDKLRRSEDQALTDAGLIVVTYIPTEVLDGRAHLLLRRLLFLWGVVLLLLLILAWYLAKAASLRRRHEQHIAESEVRLRTLSTQLISAQEDERRRLSRDLHDELGQIVTAVSLDLQRAGQAPENAKRDELILQASQETACLLEKIHEISLRVRPTLLDDLGLKDAVRSFLADYERRTGIVTRSELQFVRSDVPSATSENVFRILQEALTNVSKHSQSKEVSIRLDVTDRQVSLTVRDSGAGFSSSLVNGKGLGLLSMRERAELLGGDFHIQAEAGKGTEIHVTIPLSESEQARA